ncbi:hypothetical protein HPB50_004413 [Hyalomma asiaticum]|uniref:Uncharacterized protein n=1 Tax=Hyalomma asiaticum TaxID=266040 RepID=A0ACB7TEG3_HYAAI|nr:hypothetical protein HPB50_004413 [Hyalomma asiaticum]
MALRGHLALVIGGNSGIGEAVCHALAAEGATVVIAGRRLDLAKKVAESLPGDEHQAMSVDVADSASVDQLFANVTSTFAQPISIVVNSAGILRRAPLVESSDELFDEIMSVNLRGAFLVTRAAGRHMANASKDLPDGGGAIVNVSSILAKTGWLNGAVYSASKAAVVALTKSAAQELGVHGIRCNAVLPGLTETPMITALSEEVQDRARQISPLKRIAQPREIAEAIKYLCLPMASSFVTGAAFEVAGGCHM